jgi:hypothetical protein
MSNILLLHDANAALRAQMTKNDKLGVLNDGLKLQLNKNLREIRKIQQEAHAEFRKNMRTPKKPPQAAGPEAADALAEREAADALAARAAAKALAAREASERAAADALAEREALAAREAAEALADEQAAKARRAIEAERAAAEALAEREAAEAQRAIVAARTRPVVPVRSTWFGPSTFVVSPDGVLTFRDGNRIQLRKVRPSAEHMMPRQKGGMCYVHSLYNSILNNPLLFDAVVAHLTQRTLGDAKYYPELGLHDTLASVVPFGSAAEHDVNAFVKVLVGQHVRRDKAAFQWARDVISLTTLLAAPTLTEHDREAQRASKAEAARLVTTLTLGEITSKRSRSTGTPKTRTFMDADSLAKWGDGGDKLAALTAFFQQSGLDVRPLQYAMNGNNAEYLVSFPNGLRAVIRKRTNGLVGQGLHGYDTSGVLGETTARGGQHATAYYRDRDDNIIVVDSNWTAGARLDAQRGGDPRGPRTTSIEVKDYVSVLVGHSVRSSQRGGSPTGVQDIAVEALDDMPYLDGAALDAAQIDQKQQDAYVLALTILQNTPRSDTAMQGGGARWGLAAGLLALTAATAFVPR